MANLDPRAHQELREKHLLTQTIQNDELELSDGVRVNASGHVQEVDRNFNLLSIAAMGMTTGASWPSLGGSIIVALYNGGPPGVIYEFIAVNIFYWFVAASIAELASSIPSSAAVYHWASVGGGPRWGKTLGWFAGYWNCLAWILGTASISSIAGQIIVSMWALFHNDYVFRRWHVFIPYLICSTGCCLTVLYAHRALPAIYRVSFFFVLGGVIVTILICAIMPSTTGSGYATNDFVWTIWVNETGYPSGFAFLAGMLNGAFAVGTPDLTSHLAEEIPNPRKNIPKAVFAQMICGFVTSVPYLVAIFYSVHSINDVYGSKVPFPIAAIYLQSTNSKAGAFGLLLVLLFPIISTIIGGYITCGRMLWTLARDDATPFSSFLGKVHPRFRNQFNATVVCGCIVTVYGAIYVGSLTAFNAFVGAFIILSTLSYVAAILPNVLFRDRYIKAGPFNLGRTWGRIVGGIASAYIIVFIVIYCFPYYIPTSAKSMNYASLITGGLTIFTGLWYLWKRSHGYKGPTILLADMSGHLDVLEPGNEKM